MSAFADALMKWLANPYIDVRMTPSAEVEYLRTENQFLHDEVARLQALYGKECNYSMRLQDILDSHGISWR